MTHHYDYGADDGTNVNTVILVKDCILPVPVNLQCPVHLSIIFFKYVHFFV